MAKNAKYKECKKYSKNLYTKFPTNQQNIERKITNDQNKTLTVPTPKKEMEAALSEMENGKAPGIDELPIEFYETNFELIQNDLQQL